MLRFYWDNVFRFHIRSVLLIAAMALMASFLQVANLGMVIPILGILMNETTDPAVINFPLLSYLDPYLEGMSKIHVILILLFVAIGLLVLKNAFTIVRSYVSLRLLTIVRFTLSADMFHRSIRASYLSQAYRPRGAIFHDIWEPPIYVSNVVRAGSDFISGILQFVVLTMLMLWISWKLTLLASLVAISAIFLISRAFRNSLRLIGERSYHLLETARALTSDTLHGIRQIKAYVAENRVVSEFTRIIDGIKENEFHHARLRYLPAPLNEIFAATAVVTLLVLATFVPYFHLEFAYIVAFVLTLNRLSPAMNAITESKMALDTAHKNVKVVVQMLSQLPLENNHGKEIPPARIGNVLLESVRFSYPSRPNHIVLHDVDLQFEVGHVTAIVGVSGSGKSTIADLVIRLFQPLEGKITVDGIDINTLELGAWRRCIGFVSQDTFLFHESIRDNIAIASPNAPLADVKRVAKVSYIHDFIETLPEGYETIAGDRGVKFSGGQRQRIAIARALLGNPRILIFDEATSEMDNLTERAIQETIDSLRHDRIVIVIAHRLSTIVNANKIIVLDKGCVVEQGSHSDLIENGDVYSHLFAPVGG